ncbi:Uncharacterised protein [Capnocytophaga canimorsus]|nr:hypothetical protein CCAN2_1860022 [Capnocytophaga canimorsus]VEJ20196.1 Uncharacterised protein [Capnocytophaga canimorsus]
MKNYPTDITDNQWQFIKKTLNFNERKRKHDLRTIWNAIMYLVKQDANGGCYLVIFQNGNWFTTIASGQMQRILIYFFPNYAKK